MFDNIGGKIKGLAKFICWLGIIACVIGGIVMIVQGNELSRYSYRYEQTGSGMIAGGVALAIIGSIFSWLSSLALYGFGELIDRAISIDNKLGRNKDAVSTQSTDNQVSKPTSGQVSKPVSAAASKSESKPVLTSTALEKPKPLSKKEFMAELEHMDSMVDIWNIWRKTNLDSAYYDVHDYIRTNKDQEQLYGKTENIEKIKETIREMLEK